MKPHLLLLFAPFLAGCAITDYPVIFDSRGAGEEMVVDTGYQAAYIQPSVQAATVWDDGTDQVITLVSQDWTGDQWIKTYLNFDPTSAVVFLDQTYCDPFSSLDPAGWCIAAWNPDLPGDSPHGTPPGTGDDPFDYILNPGVSGARSLSLLLAMNSRVGECGSGLWYDKQALMYEFSLLERVNWHGRPYYLVPIDGLNTEVRITGEDGAVEAMPIYGIFRLYVDDRVRMAIPMTPNSKYQLRWIEGFTAGHGPTLRGQLTYGSLVADFQAKVTTTAGLARRL